MGVSDPHDYAPLLPIGRHTLTVRQVRTLCVTRFSSSTRRRQIFRGLIEVVRVLRSAAVIGELWIDGSFLTEKIDPGDVDVVFYGDGQVIDAAPQRVRDALNWLTDDDVKKIHLCHCFPIFFWSKQHPNYWIGEYTDAYWMKQWGFSRTESVKGIAVLKLT